MTDAVSLRLNGRELSAPRGRTLLTVILEAGEPIATACGGVGRCHLCRVQITEGRETLPPANLIEQRALGNVLVATGWRLACQILVDTPLAVTVPEVRKRRTAWPATSTAKISTQAATTPASVSAETAAPATTAAGTPSPSVAAGPAEAKPRRRRRRRGGRR